MRLIRTPSRQQAARSVNIPSPTGGWNTRDDKSAMSPVDAVDMINWFPDVGSVKTRRGFTEFASGMGADVKTLMSFNAGASNKFLAAADGQVWDITAGSTASSLSTGYSSDEWVWAQFDDASGGARLGMVNTGTSASDIAKIYNGSTVSDMTISGSITNANIVGIAVFKNRTFFWEKDSQDFWYSSLNALGGALTKFPLGRVTGFGGKLVAIGTWSQDAGDGKDDLAVFVFSTGDLVIYQGTNPGDAAAWSLVGIFRVGEPIGGARSVVKEGGDLIIITKNGYVPISRVLQRGDLAAAEQALKIDGAVNEAAINYGDNFGWQAVHYPRGKMMLVNVPVSSDTSHQHVVNTQTRAWTKFTGMNAFCWGIYDSRLYFGANDKVYLADEGTNDDGNTIFCSCQQAFTDLGIPGTNKQVTFINPNFESEADLDIGLSVSYDYKPPSTSFTTVTYAASGAEWDTAPWDTSDWAEDQTQIRPKVSVTGIGETVSLRAIADISGQRVTWFDTNYAFKIGGII